MTHEVQVLVPNVDGWWGVSSLGHYFSLLEADDQAKFTTCLG